MPVFSVLDGATRTALGGDVRALKTGNYRIPVDFGGNTYWLVAMSKRTPPIQFDGPILAAFMRPSAAVELAALIGVMDVVYVRQSAEEAAIFAADCGSRELAIPPE